MARTNFENRTLQTAARTHEGAPAYDPSKLTALQHLQRAVLSCFLWEDTFYESGKEIGSRILNLCNEVNPEDLALLAVKARHDYKLRHAPLLLLLGLDANLNSRLVGDTVKAVIDRPDEMGELISLYWKLHGKRKSSLTHQMKLGIARRFRRFDQYQLSKWRRNSDAIKLRDVMFLTHPKPLDEEQAALFKALIEDKLETANTWETGLSAAGSKEKTAGEVKEDKKDVFERLLTSNKMGALALLRNLRKMTEVGVDKSLIETALRKANWTKVLPMRFITAARHAVGFEPILDEQFGRLVNAEGNAFDGTTVLLVDVSGSMSWDRMSGRSELTRMDAACALSACVGGNRKVFSFSNQVKEVPPRQGMSLIDAIQNSQTHGGTQLGAAVHTIMERVAYDRLIVITDEQAHDRVPQPTHGRNYMINVGSYRNGVGYGKWTHIDGFSEATIKFIQTLEREGL